MNFEDWWAKYGKTAKEYGSKEQWQIYLDMANLAGFYKSAYPARLNLYSCQDSNKTDPLWTRKWFLGWRFDKGFVDKTSAGDGFAKWNCKRTDKKRAKKFLKAYRMFGGQGLEWLIRGGIATRWYWDNDTLGYCDFRLGWTRWWKRHGKKAKNYGTRR